MNSLCWLDLLKKKAKWTSVKMLGETKFSGHYERDARAVKNEVVYFGRWKGE